MAESQRADASADLGQVLVQLARNPALSHVRADQILIVAGAARQNARASIRPLGGPRKPRIRVLSTPIRYEITLRPRFFREATPRQRLVILAHELLHISESFDGTLNQAPHGPALDARAEALADFDPPVLAYRGLLWLKAWLVRPATEYPADWAGRLEFTEADLYLAPVEQL